MMGDRTIHLSESGKINPSTEAELAAIVADCHDRSEGVCIAGGWTRIPLGTVQAQHQLTTHALTGIVDYEPGELTLIVRAGTPIADIEAVLSGAGQQLAFEPMDSRRLLGVNGTPTIGGVVAANVSGPRRIIAGACRDHLLGVRFVDGNGRILKSGGRVMKNVTGLDLGKLLCGSYGTLGILTEVALKTLPAPPCQQTLALHGMSASHAVGIFAKALATPFEVTGAAYHEGTAWLRLEGLERQVAYRRGRLQALFAGEEIEVIQDADSRSCWRSLRDVEHFGGADTPLWRVLVKPTEAPTSIAALERLGGRTSIDWGGGLVWYCGPGGGGSVRAALPTGHATLVRRGRLLASEIFHPALAPVAGLAASLRRTFDPASILNPGLMGA